MPNYVYDDIMTITVRVVVIIWVATCTPEGAGAADTREGEGWNSSHRQRLVRRQCTEEAQTLGPDGR